MADPLDILSSIRAVLNGAGVGSSARPTSRVDTFGQAGYGTNSGDRSAEVSCLLRFLVCRWLTGTGGQPEMGE